jgi:hypothetical protein
VDRLTAATGIHEHEAIGVLVTFWSGVAEHASNGHIASASDQQLEKWARWRRKRGAFAAWVRNEHQDPEGRVPEWDDYAGELEYQRARNRAHQKAYRERRNQRIGALAKHDDNGDVSGDIRLTSPTTVRYGTERDGTERDEVGQKKELPFRGRAKKPRATAEQPSWVAVLVDVWVDKIGDVTHARLGKALKSIVAKYGIEAVVAAIKIYASPDEGPRTGARRVEYFAAEFVRWHTIAMTPLVDGYGALTERGKRIGMPA